MPRILPLLLALSCIASCSDPKSGEGSTDPGDAIAVEVQGIGIDQHSESPVLLLGEANGERVLPIWIGPSEARSIAARIESIDAVRPNTHDLAKRLLVGLDAAIDRVTVTELRGNTYYAIVRVRRDGESYEIDARPSDAVAMALRFDAPVFVHRDLFDAHAGERGQDETASPGDEIRL